MLSKKSKKRVIAGVVGLSLIGGTVFAATDAGYTFQSWYMNSNEGLFATTNRVTTTLENYEKQVTPGLVSWYNGVIGSSTKAVQDAGDKATGDANKAINAYRDTQLASLDKSYKADLSGMDYFFGLNISNNKKAIDNLETKYGTLAINDVTSTVNGKGTTVNGNVSTDVTTTKNAAAKALQDAIDADKAEVKRLLAEKETAANTELQAYIDGKITAKTAEIEKLAADLVAANNKTIAKTGQDIQAAAITQLDDIAASINK